MNDSKHGEAKCPDLKHFEEEYPGQASSIGNAMRKQDGWKQTAILPPARTLVGDLITELRFWGGNGESDSQACMLRVAEYLAATPAAPSSGRDAVLEEVIAKAWWAVLSPDDPMPEAGTLAGDSLRTHARAVAVALRTTPDSPNAK